MGFVPTADGYRRAREAADKALALDPQLVDAHLAMGWIHSTYDWDWAAADASFRKALDLEPGSSQALRHAGGQALNLGRWSEALDLVKQGHRARSAAAEYFQQPGLHVAGSGARLGGRGRVSQGPRTRSGRGHSGTSHSGGRCSCRARSTPPCRRCSRKRTTVGGSQDCRSYFTRSAGAASPTTALAALKEKYAGDSAYQIAEVHAFRGEVDLAFEWLDRAYKQRDGGITEIKSDRLMRGLVGDPRYKAFLRKLKLPE